MTFLSRASFRLLATSLVAVSLAASAQTAPGPTSSAIQSAPSPATDISQYPTNDHLLPGKGPAQTWADFPKIWAQRHAEWRPLAAFDHGAVVFLGDSITQGWSTLAKDFPHLKVANRGIGGDTTRGVLYRLDADVLALQPAAIVLLIGTNDIGLGADPAEVADNVKEIIAAIRRFNARTPVVLCKVMPSSAAKQRPGAKIKSLNTRLEALAKSDPHLALCDTWSLYADANGDCRAEEFPDHLHPNAPAYAKWAAALRPLLASLDLGSAARQ